MEVFAKSARGVWYDVPQPTEGEPIMMNEVFRDPIDNTPSTHVQFGGEMPEQPQPPAAHVFNNQKA